MSFEPTLLQFFIFDFHIDSNYTTMGLFYPLVNSHQTLCKRNKLYGVAV